MSSRVTNCWICDREINVSAAWSYREYETREKEVFIENKVCYEHWADFTLLPIPFCEVYK